MSKTELKSPESTSFYWKSWRNLYIATLFCWLPFIINFLWGNHDWQWVKEYTPLNSGLFEGRFTQFILPTILTDGNILPVMSISLGFAFYSASAVLLLQLLNIRKQSNTYLFLGLLITTAPYTISWLYFAFLILSCLSWPFFILLGFTFLSNHNSYPKSKFACATLLFTAALGGYPPVINMMGGIFFILMLNDLCLQKTPLKALIKKYLYIGSSLLLAILLFYLTIHMMSKLHLINGTYNTSSITLAEIPGKIFPTLEIAVKQFITTTNFINAFYKYILCALVLGALLQLFTLLPKRITFYTLFTAAIIGTLLSTVITVFSAKNTIYAAYETRIEFYGLLYTYIYAITVLWQSPHRIIRNITLVAGIFILFYNIHTAAYAAKVWSLGFKAESKLSDRIIETIETYPEFNTGHKYTFVQGGELHYRARFYTPNNESRIDSYTLDAPYIPWHLPSKAYKFYYPIDVFGEDFDIFWSYVDPDKILMTPGLIDYLRYDARPWPNTNAVYINNETIILTLTPKGRKSAQDWINYYW